MSPVAVIIVTGCVNQEMGTHNQTATPVQITTFVQTATSVEMINSDSIVGYWGTIYYGDYVSLEVYDNGTGTWSGYTRSGRGDEIPTTWAKNANGTYTLITGGPTLGIFSGNNLTVVDGTDKVTLFRGFADPYG